MQYLGYQNENNLWVDLQTVDIMRNVLVWIELQKNFLLMELNKNQQAIKVI